jgi:glutathione S-transferase
LEEVKALTQTKGPYFFDFMMTTTTTTTTPPYPTMIDFVFASHVERMLASCAYWKGMDLRSEKQYRQLRALQQWMDALEQKEYYLAFKCGYYTHIKYPSTIRTKLPSYYLCRSYQPVSKHDFG